MYLLLTLLYQTEDLLQTNYNAKDKINAIVNKILVWNTVITAQELLQCVTIKILGMILKWMVLEIIFKIFWFEFINGDK